MIGLKDSNALLVENSYEQPYYANMTCSCWGKQGQSRSLSYFTTKRLMKTLKGPGLQGSQKICVVNELPNITTPAPKPYSYMHTQILTVSTTAL